MKMHATITPSSNIDWANNSVIDNNKISCITKDWEDTVTVKIIENVGSGEKEIKMKNISLFKHFLIHNGKEHIILHALSKN